MKIKLLIIIMFGFFVSELYSQETDDNPLVHYAGLHFGTTTIFNNYTSMHFGLNYELKKYNGKLGIGWFGDFVFGPNLEFLTGFPIYWHNVFGEDLYIAAGIGFGYTRSLKYGRNLSPDDPDFDNNFSRLNFLLRFGSGWEFFVINKNDNKEIIKFNPYINVDILAMYKTYMTFGISASYYIY